MVLVTPHGKAEVVGTILKLRVDAESTRLEMAEGKVRLTLKDGSAFVEVQGGFYAVIAEGVPLVAKPLRARSAGTPSGKPKR